MLIAVELIDIVSGLREDTAEERGQLDLSIKHQGLLQPIVVAENREIPGRYVCIAGRRRLLSHRRLGLESIHCTVIEGDEVRRDLVEVAENLVRKDLSPLERDRSLKRFVDLWAAQHPEIAESMRRRHARHAPGTGRFANGSPLEVEGAPKSAVRAVADATGKSVRSVQESVHRVETVRGFTEDQQAVLNASRLSARRIDRLARIEDPKQAAEVINLVASNMAFPAAMREVLGEDYEGDAEEDDEQGSDEEFLDGLPLRTRVDRTKFDADALLWRHAAEARRAFARSIGWSARKKAVGPKGLYFRRILLMLEAPHPNRWLQCHACVRGVTRAGGMVGECRNCRGGGYVMQ
jgi:ParB family chromosome partitioning protein